MGRLGREAVLFQDLAHDRQDLGEEFRCRVQGGAFRREGHLDPLHHVRPPRPRLLGFGLLGAEAHELEEVGEAGEGGACEVIPVDAIEVVRVVAAHDEEERPREELKGIPCAVEVPHRGCRPEAHREVEPGPEAVWSIVPLCAGTLTGHCR